MLYFKFFLFESGKLSLQNHVKSFSVPGVGWVYVRQACAGERAGRCLRSSGASVFLWEDLVALMVLSFPLWVWVAGARTPPCEPGTRPWAGLLVWWDLQEWQQAWARPLCWVLRSRSGSSHSCSQALEIRVLSRRQQGWWGRLSDGEWRGKVAGDLSTSVYVVKYPWSDFLSGLWVLAKFAVFTELCGEPVL